jgi:hypothetical protein
MTQKSLAYDNPAYLAVLPIPLLGSATATFTGASTASAKFAAFTGLIVKSFTASATTVGTSSVASNALTAYKISNNGTTAVNTSTTTYTLTPTGVPGPNGTAVTTAAYVVNAVPATPITMLQGDLLYVTKGTDATEVLTVVAEAVIAPLANVTV